MVWPDEAQCPRGLTVQRTELPAIRSRDLSSKRADRRRSPANNDRLKGSPVRTERATSDFVADLEVAAAPSGWTEKPSSSCPLLTCCEQACGVGFLAKFFAELMLSAELPPDIAVVQPNVLQEMAEEEPRGDVEAPEAQWDLLSGNTVGMTENHGWVVVP